MLKTKQTNHKKIKDASQNISMSVNKQLIEKYLNKARQEILSVLIDKHHLVPEKAKTIEERIFNLTKILIHEKYFQSESIFPKYSFIDVSAGYEDFRDWWWVALTIPFYQSLGDTIGYYNGNREFNYGDPTVGPEYTNELIYEFISLGGINDLSIVNWFSSDDTIMYMATFRILSSKIIDINDYGTRLRLAYLEIIPLMENRHPGNTTMRSLDIQKNIQWDKLQYNSMAIGAGACMRSGCIGIFFPGKHNRKKLIALAVETSRITHNSAIAILGSIVAALFTAYALEKVPINHWPHKLMRLLKSNKIDKYMEKSRPHEYQLYLRDKILFVGQWEKYLTFRFSGLNPRLDLKWMKNPVKRIEYLTENFSKGHTNFPGSTGDDAVIMAYDALLESGDVIEKLIVYSILHPGDSDTVGSIAFSWFGAFYHSMKNEKLLADRFEELEFHDQLSDFMVINFNRMIKVYYYDIYLHFARKYIKKIIKE